MIEESVNSAQSQPRGPMKAAPCTNAGTPAPGTIDRITKAINELSKDATYLARHGLTTTEYASNLNQAIESIRGSISATNKSKRQFIKTILDKLVEERIIQNFTIPTYGKNTVYRVIANDRQKIAIIQKGCPDGNHSSTAWETPSWADETYIWWLCSSRALHPGEHISKGVNRIRKRFQDSEVDGERMIDGVIFHNEICGTAIRPCPKMKQGLEIDGTQIPPPCIYILPENNEEGAPLNWHGARNLAFPEILLSIFNIKANEIPTYIGFIGFSSQPSERSRTKISSRFGPAQTTTALI